jgi:hypothetical protein
MPDVETHLVPRSADSTQCLHQWAGELDRGLGLEEEETPLRKLINACYVVSVQQNAISLA